MMDPLTLKSGHQLDGGFFLKPGISFARSRTNF